LRRRRTVGLIGVQLIQTGCAGSRIGVDRGSFGGDCWEAELLPGGAHVARFRQTGHLWSVRVKVDSIR